MAKLVIKCFFPIWGKCCWFTKKINDFKGNATDVAFDTVLFTGTCNADLNFEEFFSYFKDNAIGCVYLILTIEIIISKQLSNFWHLKLSYKTDWIYVFQSSSKMVDSIVKALADIKTMFEQHWCQWRLVIQNCVESYLFWFIWGFFFLHLDCVHQYTLSDHDFQKLKTYHQ